MSMRWWRTTPQVCRWRPTCAAHAQDASAEQKAVEIRQSVFKLLEWNYTPTGDQKAFEQAAIAVGKACGACHDNYRDK